MCIMYMCEQIIDSQHIWIVDCHLEIILQSLFPFMCKSRQKANTELSL